MIVVTSFRWGTLHTVTVSEVSKVPARIGKLAFFAPDIEISPSSRVPPRMSNLSNAVSDLTRRLQFAPFPRRVCANRQCVDFIAHQRSQAFIYQLMALHRTLAVERFRHNYGLEVRIVVRLHRNAGVRQTSFDQCGDL